MTLGDRIRQARERVGLSQIELARRIGLSKNAMNSSRNVSAMAKVDIFKPAEYWLQCVSFQARSAQ